MSSGVLDLAPVMPPSLGTEPAGRRVTFDELVRDAGMHNVVTMPYLPDIRVHGGSRDFRVPGPGGSVYCISGTRLPADPHGRAREILRRLAYGFNDYAAREVVARHHRDLKRAELTPEIETEDEARAARRALSTAALRVKRALRKCREASIGELAKMTGMAQPNVSRTVAALVKNGVVSVAKDGKRVICRLAPKIETPAETAPARPIYKGQTRP
jgi:DNA-binding transcriptional ArsR family regulator